MGWNPIKDLKKLINPVWQVQEDLISDLSGGGSTSINVPGEPGPSQTELDIQKEILSMLQEDRELSPTQLAIEELTLQMLQQQMDNLPMEQEERDAAHAIFMQQIDEYNSPEATARRALSAELVDFQMEQIQTARELGDITGDLSEQEMTALDTMETNAIQTLTNTVQEQTEEMMGKTIAQMVDRGVLQGDIGAKAMADIGESSAEAIAEGTAAITSQKMGSILGMGEAQKNRQLQIQGMVQAGAMGREAAQQGWAGQAFSLAGGQQNVNLGFAQTANQFSAGLSQDWDKSQLMGGVQQWGQMAGVRGGEAQRALSLGIAQSQAEQARYATQMGLWGNIIGGGMSGAGAAMGSSRDFKKDIKEITGIDEKDILDKIKDVKIYTYKYKDEIDVEQKEHVGIVTEEAPQEIVTSDGKHLDVINYFGYLTACIKVLAQKVEQLQEN